MSLRSMCVVCWPGSLCCGSSGLAKFNWANNVVFQWLFRLRKAKWADTMMSFIKLIYIVWDQWRQAFSIWVFLSNVGFYAGSVQALMLSDNTGDHTITPPEKAPSVQETVKSNQWRLWSFRGGRPSRHIWAWASKSRISRIEKPWVVTREISIHLPPSWSFLILQICNYATNLWSYILTSYRWDLGHVILASNLQPL